MTSFSRNLRGAGRQEKPRNNAPPRWRALRQIFGISAEAEGIEPCEAPGARQTPPIRAQDSRSRVDIVKGYQHSISNRQATRRSGGPRRARGATSAEQATRGCRGVAAGRARPVPRPGCNRMHPTHESTQARTEVARQAAVQVGRRGGARRVGRVASARGGANNRLTEVQSGAGFTRAASNTCMPPHRHALRRLHAQRGAGERTSRDRGKHVYGANECIFVILLAHPLPTFRRLATHTACPVAAAHIHACTRERGSACGEAGNQLHPPLHRSVPTSSL